jgi:hypothetical protein
MTDLVQRQVLRALFCLSRDTRPISAVTIADASGITPTRAAEALVELERGGWVDASRARLTLRGLALAVRIRDGAGGLGKKRAASRVQMQAPAVEPWAAARGPGDLTPSVGVALGAITGCSVALDTQVSDSPSPGGRALERGLLGATGNGLHS